ncbi:hypothetical protein COB72_06125 [bacterium]|nr:MAG: hypothetical protein COB72_06125 [bacterium]
MPATPPSRSTKPAFAIWCLTLVIVLVVRILAPSDLGQNLDQSKTIAFTLDMVQNNHWILPVDSLADPTHKPPMVNWFGAPIVAMGFHSELALKLPAIISGITISILIFFAARFLFRKLDQDSLDNADRAIATHATPLAFLTSAAWFASPSAIKHIYFMRPDILFAALLVIAWFTSVVLLSNDQPNKPKRLALLIWLLAAAAALTKGPLALLIPLYLLLHILIITPKGERKPALARTQWQWGIPIMLIIPGLWLWAAYRINPDHVTNTLFAKELGSRLGNGGPSGILAAALANPAYFFERFLPWCLPAALAILFKPSRHLRSHPMGPAILWVLLVLAATTLASLNAGSYIMPAYPAAAILAIYALFRIIASPQAARIKPAFISLAILIIFSASLITTREATMSRAARTNTGQHIKAFAKSASQHIQSDQIRFHQMGDLPIASLMGKHQPADINPNPSHHWLIQPTHIDPAATPILVSDPIVTHDPDSGEPIDTTIQIGLYPIP